MSIETYGIKMIGLNEASQATCDWPAGSGRYNIIKRDPETGEVWASEAVGDRIAGEYEVFRTAQHVSAQRIADEIHEQVRLSALTPQARYDAKNTSLVTLKLNNKYDADILSRLAAQPKETGGKQGYIKRLIRADMEKEKRNE